MPERSLDKMAPSQPNIPAVESIWRLGGRGSWQLTKVVIRRVNKDDLLGRASELAFNFLLALIPLLVFMLALFGIFASHSYELQSSLLYYVSQFVPPPAFQLLRATMIELAGNATSGKVTLGIVLVLWFASGGMSSMISTLNAAYHVQESRSWLKIRAIALGLTIVISLLLLTSLLIVLVGSHFVDLIGTRIRLSAVVVIVWKGLQWAAVALFVTLSFSLIYYCGPTLGGRRRWHWSTPGSVFGGFLWMTASLGFRLYLHFLNTYTAVYGSLGAVMILLVWLYVTGLALLVGGTINAEVASLAMHSRCTEARGKE